jgi:hypothetical protein
MGVDGIRWGFCPVAGFDISTFEPLNFAITVLNT